MIRDSAYNKILFRQEVLGLLERDRVWTEWQAFDLKSAFRGPLIRAGLSVDDVRQMPDSELLRHRGIGTKALAEIRRVLS